MSLHLGRVLGFIVVGIGCFAFGYLIHSLIFQSQSPSSLLLGISNSPAPSSNPYPPYRFSALENTDFHSEPISVLSVMKSDPAYTSYVVSWQVPDLNSAQSQKVTGQMNVPTGEGPFPVIVMSRGFIDKDQYQTGIGTKNAAAVYVKSGYITIAPDFLGYADSDPEPTDGLLSRFQRPVTVLQLLKNLDDPSLVSTVSAAPAKTIFASGKIGLWGHSNGGQITLSILEITNHKYPTVLWAPVSKPFPFSVLFFSDEQADYGKSLRHNLATFEDTLNNDVADYTILSTPERILGPVLIEQGGSDPTVPVVWSQDLAKLLQKQKTLASITVYPASDHNLQPDWNAVVQKDLQFYAKELKDN